MNPHDQEQQAAKKHAQMLALAITTRTDLERSGQAMPAEQLEFEKRLGIVRREDWLPHDLVQKMKDAPDKVSKQEYDLASHECGKLLKAMNKDMLNLDACRNAGTSDEECLDKKHAQQDRLQKKQEKLQASWQQCAECLEHTTKRCDRCKTVYYCSRDCQRRGWKTHKMDCKAQQASS